jgi:hypothetical protein
VLGKIRIIYIEIQSLGGEQRDRGNRSLGDDNTLEMSGIFNGKCFIIIDVWNQV